MVWKAMKGGGPPFEPHQGQFSLPVAIQILHKTAVCKRLRTEGMAQWIISAGQ